MGADERGMRQQAGDVADVRAPARLKLSSTLFFPRGMVLRFIQGVFRVVRGRRLVVARGFEQGCIGKSPSAMLPLGTSLGHEFVKASCQTRTRDQLVTKRCWSRVCRELSDPDFSILAACYPYLARRLLTDSDNPRTQQAL